MRRALILVGTLLVLVFLSVVLLQYWLGIDTGENPIDVMSQPTELRYAVLEIRDYQGVRLDPAIGPRDNSIRGIQDVNMDDYTLTVSGEVEQRVVYSYTQVLSKEAQKRLITLYCVEGWDATILWEGIRIMDLIADAGMTEEAKVLIFHCYDGYTTSMPVETVRERDMLLAYSANNVTLPKSLGFPFIVVAEDKLGYKWARWVIGIEVSSHMNYKGFWEGEGFSNDAEVDP